MAAKGLLAAACLASEKTRARVNGTLMAARAWRGHLEVSCLEPSQFRFAVACAPMIDVIHVEALSDAVLSIGFSTGEKRLLSYASCKGELPGIFPGEKQFSRVRIERGSLIWQEGAEAAPELVYAISSPA